MPNENNKEKKDHGKILASWQFPEFIKYKRSLGWYLVAIIIMAALLVFSVWQKIYLLVLIVAMFVVIYYVRGKRESRTVTINITEDGIELDETFYEYRGIKNFWIIYNPPDVKKLYFSFKSGLRPSFSISLENQNPLRVREILLKYMQEDIEKDDESFTDGLMRILKL